MREIHLRFFWGSSIIPTVGMKINKTICKQYLRLKRVCSTKKSKTVCR